MTRRDALICLLLAGITVGIYWPVQYFEATNFDDPDTLTYCAPLKAGLTWSSLQWAGTGVVVANWAPVTNLSFLLVSQFFGTAPGPHHLANAIIHAANAALLFLLLFRLTNAPWRSAVVAAIFAWHPLRVESVAWIAERKDVLCGFFFLLSLLAYVRFAKKRAGSQRAPWRTMDFNVSLLMFALALLSKPMAVTLPFVLLLLDFWPLQRMAVATGERRWSLRSVMAPCLEKWPFFGLTILFCVSTYYVQQHSTAVMAGSVLSLDGRCANAAAGYVAYLAKLFWPTKLAAIYLLPIHFDPTEALLKAGLLVAISLGCLYQINRRPWLAMGWFWYLGMAVPVIGIVQVGEQSMADRYTYLPLIGPVIIIVWAAAEVFSRWQHGKAILTALAIVILGVLTALTERQLQFWHDSVTLFNHTVAVTPPNPPALFNLADGYQQAGETNLAINTYRVILRIVPGDLYSSHALANLLAEQGHLAAAEAVYNRSLERKPDDPLAHLGLANIYAAEGRMNDYISQLNEVVRLNPDDIETLNNLAWVLASDPHPENRDGARAVMLAEHACELTKYQGTVLIGTLAAAYAEAGRFDEAVATAQRACDTARKNGETMLLQRNQELLERYRQHKMAHD